ncbi:LamG domain-containing protein [Pseudomonas sp. MYb185]|uniref:LamG domain-containing protein n=1 Tax=Pseudomonas sp. MYb185 TaxID=1848729 RepID=UPI000CFC56ED|nr:LamG domain-containing protein [Pseudomonas sp. MYb185]PRB80533.1 hypothetical protein CQ007_12500 [Pseudomonas sp. MYb185]
MAEEDLWFGTLSATVRVEDLPATRQVVAIERPEVGDWRVCGAGSSNAEGVATIPITGLPTSRIYAVVVDDWGRPFIPEMSVIPGEIVRPTHFVGWMYRVTQAGVLPAEEPAWWNSMAGIPREVGTAMVESIRHYQPIAHGPVSDIDWADREFDLYWDNVVLLLQPPFAGSGVIDHKGRHVFTTSGGFGVSESDLLFGQPTLQMSGGTYFQAPDSEDWDFGAEDFTVELWYKQTTTPSSYQGLISQQGSSASTRNAWKIITNNSASALVGQASTTGAANTNNVSGPPFLQNEWVHVAFIRSGQYLTLFVDGVAGSSNFIGSQAIYNSSEPLRIGRQASTNMVGRLGPIRVTKGIARYTENFVPPTGPFLTEGPLL